jgi:pyrimidine dimer DNA glycosylase
MQTFLPYSSFKLSAYSLDRLRLGKQRIEALQILRTLMGVSSGWSNHPAVRMWCGHEFHLSRYGIAICDEWIERKYNDTCYEKFIEFQFLCTQQKKGFDPPHWLGNLEFHKSHQSNLIRKLPERYKSFWPCVPNNLPYIWPV